jgi:predicted nucleic acid-binding Zn ribbon protein
MTARIETLRCSACGRGVQRKSRQQRFCSDRCRQYAHRENKARTAIKNPAKYQDTGPVTNPLFLSNKNNGLRGQKSRFSVPLNLLGGYRWPGADSIEPETLCKIIRAEIGGKVLP